LLVRLIRQEVPFSLAANGAGLPAGRTGNKFASKIQLNKLVSTPSFQ
jgi:hypothetical protein